MCIQPMPGLRLHPVHKFSKKLRRSILTGYSQFMSGDKNGADPSYVGNDDVNTFYGDVIVAYPVPVVGNGIAQSLYFQQMYRKGKTF